MCYLLFITTFLYNYKTEKSGSLHFLKFLLNGILDFLLLFFVNI